MKKRNRFINPNSLKKISWAYSFNFNFKSIILFVFTTVTDHLGLVSAQTLNKLLFKRLRQ